MNIDKRKIFGERLCAYACGVGGEEIFVERRKVEERKVKGKKRKKEKKKRKKSECVFERWRGILEVDGEGSLRSLRSYSKSQTDLC